MKQVNYDLKALCQQHRHGSYATQWARKKMLQQFADQLDKLGFTLNAGKGLKPKHIQGLLELWKEQGLAASTIKNRMVALRWWAQRVNKESMMGADNNAYDIPRRSYVGKNLASTFERNDVQIISDKRLRGIAMLQVEFGLRREEAIKFNPKLADCDRLIALKGSWTKGGRPREIPIIDARQRLVLNYVKTVAGFGSMIPGNMSYRQYLNQYTYAMSKIGFGHTHGFRHAYAQRRYEEMTGMKAPLLGGLRKSDMTSPQQAHAIAARRQLSKELGHGRIDVTNVYLGAP